MSDKAKRIPMAQIVAWADHPDMRRFPDENHIAVRKVLKGNFRNIKDRYTVAIDRLAKEGRQVPFALV